MENKTSYTIECLYNKQLADELVAMFETLLISKHGASMVLKTPTKNDNDEVWAYVKLFEKENNIKV